MATVFADAVSLAGTMSLAPEPNKVSRAVVLQYTMFTVFMIRAIIMIVFQKFALESSPGFSQGVSLSISSAIRLTSCVLFQCYLDRSIPKAMRNISREFTSNSRFTVIVLGVATIYSGYNVLQFVALENINLGTFMIVQQSKILFMALFVVLLLKFRPSLIQWISLTILLFGILLTKSDKLLQSDAGTEKEENLIVGISVTVFASFVTCLGTVVHEKAFKKHCTSQSLGNITLSAFIFLTTLIYALVKDGNKIFADGLGPSAIFENATRGFTWQVWAYSVVYSYEGIITSITLVYAGNVLMYFANAISLVFVCIIDWQFFGYHPTIIFVVGAVMTVVSVLLYSLNPSLCQRKVSPDDEKAAVAEP